jgi:hypothetical protein
MPFFALVYRYVDDTDLVTKHRPEHRAYLGGFAEGGTLVLAGPLGEGGRPGGLLILDVDSIERVEEFADNDPFQTHQVISERSIQQWTLSIGAARLTEGSAND